MPRKPKPAKRKTFAERVTRIYEAMGSDQAVADALQVARKTANRWRNKGDVPISKLMMLAVDALEAEVIEWEKKRTANPGIYIAPTSHARSDLPDVVLERLAHALEHTRPPTSDK